MSARVLGIGGAAGVVAVLVAGGCGTTLSAQKCQGAAPTTFNDNAAYFAAELRACAFDLSCTETDWWWPYHRSQGKAPRSCLADMNLSGLDGVACAPNARSCGDWIACATHGHCAQWCTGMGYTSGSLPLWTCDGDDLVVCGGSSDYGVVFESCGATGMHCGTTQYSAACTDGSACSQPSNPHCVGNRVVACDSSTLLEQSQDCSATGAQCVDVNLQIMTSAGCTTPGQACDATTFTPSCQGNVVVACFLGSIVNIDCTAPEIAGSCVASNGSVTCVPTATECTADTPDSCSGNDLVTCGTNQVLAHVDCTSLGFRTCGDIGGRAGCVP